MMDMIQMSAWISWTKNWSIEGYVLQDIRWCIDFIKSEMSPKRVMDSISDWLERKLAEQWWGQNLKKIMAVDFYTIYSH